MNLNEEWKILNCLMRKEDWDDFDVKTIRKKLIFYKQVMKMKGNENKAVI